MPKHHLTLGGLYTHSQGSINEEYIKFKRQEFNENSYNGPSLDDFKARLQQAYATAVWVLEKQKQEKKISEDEYLSKIGRLNESQETALNNLKRDCKIENIGLASLKKEQPVVLEKIQTAKLHIQSFVFDALMQMNPNAFQSEADLIKGLKQYEIDESHYTATQDRPDFVNTYLDPISNKTCVSIQRTIDKTIPSTERYDRDEFKGILPNFVECGVGYLDAKSNLQLDFKGYRHSSYPPIRITNDFERQKKAAEIAKNMLTELARQEMNKDQYTRQPIVLNLSSLSLLTPYALTDRLVPNDEAEARQLKESYDAMMMYQGREVTVKVGEKEVRVKLNLTMMNAPSNTWGVAISKKKSFLRKMSYSALEKDINAEGMNQFISRTIDYFEQSKSSHAAAPVLKALREIQNECNISFGDKKSRLKDIHKEIEKSFNSNHEEKYRRLKAQEAKLNKEIGNINRIMFKKMKMWVNKDRHELDNILKILKEKKTPQDEVAELFFQTLLMSVDGRVEPIQWGSRFLLANQKMGNYVDFYCKSGEDRTGRMQNMIEELCIFYRDTGRYPAYDVQTKKMNRHEQEVQGKIAISVNEFSVSRDITGQNCIGARGLQITEDLKVNRTLAAKSGDAIGKMAKGIFGLTDTGVWSEIIKRLFSIKIDSKRQSMIRKAIESSRGNVLVNESLDALDFKSRFIDALHATKEASSDSLERKDPIVRRMKKDDIVRIEKLYAGGILGQLEKSLNSVVDKTTVPPEGLPRNIREELAIEQVFAMISPPFDPKSTKLILSGDDHDQVARLHAVLLVLNRQIPSMKSLEIEVEGPSPRPSKAGAFFQKQANQDFINAHLSADALKKISSKKTEFLHLNDMKSKLHAIKSAKSSATSELEQLDGMRFPSPGGSGK